MISKQWQGVLQWLARDVLLPALILALVEMLRRSATRAYKRHRIRRTSGDVLVEELVARVPIRKATGRALMQAINDGAVRLIRGTVISTATPRTLMRLARVWDTTAFGRYAAVAGKFITPACEIDETLRPDAVAELRRWLEESAPARELHAAIYGAGGVGKTTLLNQLFLVLAESKDISVPLLASAEHIEFNSADSTELGDAGKTPLDRFVSVWFRRRHLEALSPADRSAASSAICTGLRNGSIVLLLDGIDELESKGPGIKEWVSGALSEVRRFVVTERYPRSMDRVARAHALTLCSAWDPARMLEYARLSLKGHSNAERVLNVLKQEAQERNWLSHPEQLRYYLDSVASLSDEVQMHHLAESSGAAVRTMLARAASEAPDVSMDDLVRALSIVAVADAGDSRTDPVQLVSEESLEGGRAAKLKTMTRIVERNNRSYVAFRYVAAREYFLARRLARELLNGPAHWPDAVALQRFIGEPCGPWRIEQVIEAFPKMESAVDRPTPLVDWLTTAQQFGHQSMPEFAAQAKRNLFQLWIRTTRAGDRQAARLTAVRMNLAGIDGRGLDLSNMQFDASSFENANLCDAAMTHARFIRCNFAGADLRRADGIGAEFQECDFGNGARVANVDGFEIEGAQISPLALEAELVYRGALPRRSRYHGAFGERFLAAQHTFLGKAVTSLEHGPYLQAIHDSLQAAMASRPDQPLVLVDLMAGGSPQRTDKLLETFPLLRVLSIDRDQPNVTPGARHKWARFEFGPRAIRDRDGPAPFAITELIQSAFADDSVTHADVIIAKKALHELGRELQRLLIRSCATALRPGGGLIVFEDAPGPESRPIDVAAHERSVAKHETLRTLLLEPATTPEQIRVWFDQATPHGGDAEDEWLFTNDWIAVKDWANMNRHEVESRYFASVAELREWAEPYFDSEVAATDHYDINPLRFNERGINAVLHHLERAARDRGDSTTTPEHIMETIARDRTTLLELLAGSPRCRALVDVTRTVFHRSPRLALRLQMTEKSVEFANDDPLKPLEMAETAPEFKLRCAIISFIRRRSVPDVYAPPSAQQGVGSMTEKRSASAAAR